MSEIKIPPSVKCVKDDAFVVSELKRVLVPSLLKNVVKQNSYGIVQILFYFYFYVFFGNYVMF